MTTIRAVLERRRTTCGILLVVGLVLFFSGGVAASVTERGLFLALPGFAIVAFSVWYSLYAIRCPKCRGKVGVLLNGAGTTLFQISKNFRFCPFCGVELDSEAPEPKPK
jgi:hypothetical protein